jgi:cytochrome c-type biogenesis protein CcmH/NrfG
MTYCEIALTLGAGLLIGFGALRSPRGPLYGAGTTVLLLTLTILTGLSVVWSVAPDASFQDSGRMLAYSGVFAAAVTVVRIAPERWPAVLGGLTLAAATVCGYALLTKVFPATLAPTNTAARLEEPYEYWNAIGLTAAMGAIGCLWLGARRSGHALLSALSYPAMGLMLLTLVLAYSRGALAALAIGVVLWFLIVPLRLRGAAVLICGGIGAAGVAAWDFSNSTLSSENVPLAERTTTGHELGALIATMLIALTIAGVAIGFLTARRAPSPLFRRRLGAALLGLIAVAALAFAGALAHSHRGFTGSISHAVGALTNPDAKTPPNTPGRLTAVASVRARYWKEALQVFDAHPVLGVGALGYRTARLRYRKETLEVIHAHGFVVQMLADFGIVGLLVILALLFSWLAAAGRASHPFNRRWSPWGSWRSLAGRDLPGPGWKRLPGSERNYSAERVGTLSMLVVVVVFGIHSMVDWTWYVPGDACVALICAGWLAGRGPLGARPASLVAPARERTHRRPGTVRLAVAGAAVAAALLAAWSEWQPQRSEDAREQALELLSSRPGAATAAAERAVSRDPLSTPAMFTLAEVQRDTGHPIKARATLQKAVREQPSNPATWLQLARFDLAASPQLALQELQATIYLNPQVTSPELLTYKEPEAVEVHNDYIQAYLATHNGQ